MLIAISNHGHFLGGGEHSFLDLLSHLPSDWQPAAVVPYDGELSGKLKQRGIETHSLLLPRIRPWTLFHVFASVNAYRRLVKKLHPVLIYANGSRAALYGATVGRLLGVPIIWHCRTAEPDPFLDPLLVRLNTQIVANSQATAARFSPSLRKKIRVVHNGVDLPWLQDKTVQLPQLFQKDWKVVLCVARASRWKRHDLVLAAFELVAEMHPSLNLVCLGAKDQGEPDWWDLLQQRTLQSPFAQRIHWIGQVDDVRPWYRVASAMVLASENEPFGRVLVEAMACGVPVIAARSGGIPEIILHQQDGLLVPPGNVEKLQATLASLLRDQAIRDRYVKSALERVERFSLDSHVTKMVEIFENTLNLGHLTH
jgi:glycosyltransferase involved in cell wall biosynthesis